MGVGRVSGPPRIHDQAAARGGPRNPPAVATAGEVADYGAPRSGERARRESIGAPNPPYNRRHLPSKHSSAGRV
jgi:hypothetical protein